MALTCRPAEFSTALMARLQSFRAPAAARRVQKSGNRRHNLSA
jgi:hypothetical protein